MSFLDKMRKSRASSPPSEPTPKVLPPDAQESLARSLREQIERYPNGRLYTRLAELYRDGRQPDKALEVARAGLAAFPKHDGLHYMMGLLHADKGEREEACKHLTRAAEIDKFNHAALKLLCQLLGELGRHSEAAQALAKLKSIAPKAPIPKPAAPSAGPVAPTAPAPAPAPAPEPMEKEVEEVFLVAVDEPAKTGPGGGDSLLAIALSRLIGHDGIEGAILVDAAGQTIAAALPAGQNQDVAAEAVTELRRAASPVCGELGLGGFEQAMAELISGSFYLYAIRDRSLGIYAAPRSRSSLITQHAQAFARKAATADAEGAQS